MNGWAPHAYLEEGLKQGFERGYLDSLIKEGNRVQSSGIPVIFTLPHLARICDVPAGLLYGIVRRTFGWRYPDPYRVFKIRKKSKASYRTIAVPDASLMQVQKWIHENILKSIKPHTASTAYHPGAGPRENALRHCRAKWLTKIDITDFFESISERQVYRVFRDAGYPALLSFQFTRLCTRINQHSLKYAQQRWNADRSKYSIFGCDQVGHLPQGAPTSPLLANLVCRLLDDSLARIAAESGCTYTRYADDMVFSAMDFSRERAAQLIKTVTTELSKFGFSRNRAKTQIATPGSRKIVTGLNVEGPEPRLLSEYKEKISLHLYHAGTKGIPEHCKRRGFISLLGFRAHLDGLITFAQHIEPDFGNQCRLAFDQLPWGDLTHL